MHHIETLPALSYFEAFPFSAHHVSTHSSSSRYPVDAANNHIYTEVTYCTVFIMNTKWTMSHHFWQKCLKYRTENFQNIHSKDFKTYNLRVILITLTLDHAILDAVLSQFIICQRKICNDNVQIYKCGNC